MNTKVHSFYMMSAVIVASVAIITISGWWQTRQDRLRSIEKQSRPDTVVSDTFQDAVEYPGMQGNLNADGGSLSTLSERIEYPVGDPVESIEVAVTLKDGVVVAVRNTHSKSGPRSARHQSDFDREIEGLVVGRRLEEIELDAVSGATFTTQAFMKAIRNIQTAYQTSSQ